LNRVPCNQMQLAEGYNLMLSHLAFAFVLLRCRLLRRSISGIEQTVTTWFRHHIKQ